MKRAGQEDGGDMAGAGALREQRRSDSGAAVESIVPDRRNSADPQRRRIELILEQVDALPALSPVIARLLALTADEEADIREVITLIESDVALTSRVLSLTRRADVGVREKIVTVDRAVVLLGFDALRDALLTAEVFEMLMGAGDRAAVSADVELADTDAGIDLRGLWRHSLAVACAAQKIASRRGRRNADRAVRAGDAFVCGLLHDLGKWALALVLPRTYSALARRATERQSDLAPLERRVIGVDHHTAGRRIAERWGLPKAVHDAIWLHNQPPEAMPQGAQMGVVGVTTVADAIARAAHIGWSGDDGPLRAAAAVARDWELSPVGLDDIAATLHGEVARRAWAIGLDDVAERDLLHESLQRAGQRLERARNAARAERHERVVSQSESQRSLAAVESLLRDAQRADAADAMLAVVARSVAQACGAGELLVAIRERAGDGLEILLIRDGGEVRDAHIEAAQSAALGDQGRDEQPLAQAASQAARRQGLGNGSGDWLAVFTHSSAEGEIAFLATKPASEESPDALRELWSALLRRALRDRAASRLADRLATANRALAEAQPRLAEAEAMEKLRETTAGLAHEMNTALAVISGRAQLLADESHKPPVARAAEAISDAARRLSDLVADLHLFASPVEPQSREMNLATLISEAAQEARRRAPDAPQTPIRLIAPEPAPIVFLDADHVREALVELVLNALRASPKSHVALRVHLDRVNGRLMLSVEDDGAGMSERVRSRCFDPFFSDRPAGRSRGLGLPRARRLVEASGGRIEIASRKGEGTRASIVFDRFLSGRRVREQ